MSTTGYDIYLAIKKRMEEDSAAEVKEVLGAGVTDIQHILAYKMIASKLEDGERAKTIHDAEGTLGFTEVLVNRLMHFAYLKGVRDIEQKSFQRGWDEARKVLHVALDAADLHSPAED